MLSHVLGRPRIVLLAMNLFASVVLISGVQGAQPEGIPKDAKPFTGWKVANVDAWTEKNRLYLEIQKWPEDEKIRIPRLANSVTAMDLEGLESQKLELQPEPKWWILKVGKKPEDGQKLLVIELDSKPQLFSEKIVAEVGKGQIIFLPAKHAVTKGENLRYEPQSHKNTVGYWSNAKDTAGWHFKVEKPGMYEVEILQGCGKGHGGSIVDVVVEKQILKLEVQDTGHFQNFIWKPLGTVNLIKTENGMLKIAPMTKAAGAVMDVRAIRIFPPGTERSLEPELVEPDAVPKPN